MQVRKYYKTTLVIMGLILVLMIIASVAMGRYPIKIFELFGILSSKVSGGAEAFWNNEFGVFWDSTKEGLLLNYRLPRILMACLVGCSLSAAGGAYRESFRTPWRHRIC